MEIRILAGRFDRSSGSSVYHRQLAERLARRGHRVTVVCFSGSYDALDGVEVFQVPTAAAENYRVIWRFASPINYYHIRRNFAQLHLSRVDVTIGGEHLFLQAHRQRFPDVPWVYLPHSLVVDQEIRGYGLPPLMSSITIQLYSYLQRWAMNHADCTVRFTRRACESLLQRYGRAVNPVFEVNPMGIELPDPIEHRGPRDAVRLLWVGQLIPRKRIDFALTALERLRHLSWTFDVVGDGVSRKSLEDQVSLAGLDDRVRFHGFQRDPRGWYSNSDLLIFPSVSENCPVTMLESMAHGVPCLAMKADGVRYFNANDEIIRDGIDGFLAETDEVFGIKLSSLIENPGVLKAVGAAARLAMQCNHSWDSHICRYEEFLNRIISARRRSQ